MYILLPKEESIKDKYRFYVLVLKKFSNESLELQLQRYEGRIQVQSFQKYTKLTHLLLWTMTTTRGSSKQNIKFVGTNFSLLLR